MNNYLEISPSWLLLLIITLFACTPGDIIQTTRLVEEHRSLTPTPTVPTLSSAMTIGTLEALAASTSTPILSLAPLTEVTPTSSPLPTFTSTPLPSTTPEPIFTPSATPIPSTRQFLAPPCPEQELPPTQNLKIIFSQNGELRQWENGTTTSLAAMDGKWFRVSDDGTLFIFTKDNGLWAMNSDGTQEWLLATGIDGRQVSISDDGTVIVFTKDNGLWAVNSDGTQERLLVSESDFAAMPPTNPGVQLEQIYWIPCTHQLLFNTRVQAGYGRVLADDLYVVDTDTQMLKNLFPPGKGGNIFLGPNGQQLALVTPTSITLANYDGSSPQTVLTYREIATGSEVKFYPRPMWSSDSQSLYLALPPTNPMYDNPGPTTFWNLPVYGGEAIKLSEFVAAWGKTSIAPDLSLIAYSTVIREGENISQTLHIIRPDGLEIASFPERRLFSWTPDLTHYIFQSNQDFYIGDLSGGSVQVIGVEREVIGLSWLDSTRFLVYHRDEAGQTKLSLGTIEGELILIARGNIEAYSIIR